jgi:hypothetical protein
MPAPSWESTVKGRALALTCRKPPTAYFFPLSSQKHTFLLPSALSSGCIGGLNNPGRDSTHTNGYQRKFDCKALRCLRHSASWHRRNTVVPITGPCQCPLVGRHSFTTGFNTAMMGRGIACKARKMRLEARHRKIHECTDLRNGKPALRGNEVQGHRGVLVLG